MHEGYKVSILTCNSATNEVCSCKHFKYIHWPVREAWETCMVYYYTSKYTITIQWFAEQLSYSDRVAVGDDSQVFCGFMVYSHYRLLLMNQECDSNFKRVSSINCIR